MRAAQIYAELSKQGNLKERVEMQTAEGTDVMTDYQFKALMEMFKGIVRELKDPEKIIERIEQIQKGEFEDKPK
jgi:hypothetical protein